MGDGTVSAWIQAPSWGYRLVDVDGSSQGYNPVRGATLSWVFEDDSIGVEESEGSAVYSDSDQSTLSNKSTGATSNSGDGIDNLKQAAQKMFKSNSFKRITQSRK